MSAPTSHKGQAVLYFKSQSGFLKWLEKNYHDPAGHWLLFAKVASEESSITYPEAREAAITYGWIDGLLNRIDDDWHVIKFTHRRPRSIWSKINVGIAKELIKSGRMQPEGLKEVQAAKADGRWKNAY